MNKANKKKVFVNGCPRVFDFINKNKKNKKINNLLFLSFNTKQGIPDIPKNEKLNWNNSYNEVISILNELSENKNINIKIKRKTAFVYKTSQKINPKIKIYEGGTAEKFINEADIIIGHNSGSTIESLANGKYVMIPFFEKNQKLKKYLYRFNSDIIYFSRDKLKKNIEKLINKKTSFPIMNKKNDTTVNYYFGNSRNIIKKYINFLKL